MNKHPSCQYTWQQTTLASKRVSEAFADLLSANAELEDVLLAEFSGAYNLGATERMVAKLFASKQGVLETQALIRLSIDTSRDNPDEFAGERGRLQPTVLATEWNGVLLTKSWDTIRAMAAEIQDDRLATAMRFVEALGSLLELYQPVIGAFQQAGEFAKTRALREALASNQVPVQSTFAILLSNWLVFMNEYLVDSLVATHIAFATRQHPALVEA